MGDNHRFTLGLALGAGLIVGLWLMLVAGQAGRPHPDNLWVEQAYEKKLLAAGRVEQSPRILIVAGSAAMFGVDSTAMADAWAKPVINLGVNAGIGPYFLIDYAQPVVNKGDLVIAPLEYPLYSYSGEVNQVFLSFLWSHPATISQLPPLTLVKALWITPLKRVMQGYQGIAKDFRVAGLYGPNNLDQFGDQVNSELARRDSDLHRNAVDKAAEEYGRHFTADAIGWQLWADFANSLRERGACVIFVPPPMLFKNEYAEREEDRRFYRELPEFARQAGLNYLGEPQEFLYPADWFFDTNYHLVAEQRKVYTAALISLLGDDPVRRCEEFVAPDSRPQ